MGGTSRYQEVKETQGKREGVSAMLWREKRGAAIEVSGRTGTCGHYYRGQVMDVWQGLGGTSH